MQQWKFWVMLFCCAYSLSHVWLFAAPWTARLFCPWGILAGKNTRVGCHALFQGILPIWGSNSGLPHFRQILYHLSHQGSPRILERVAYSFSRGSFPSMNQTGVSCIAGEFFTSWATREALSGSYGNSNFIFVWNFHTVFTAAAPIYIPTNSVKMLPCLHILANICYFWCYDDNHSERFEVLSHCGFDLHFPTDELYKYSGGLSSWCRTPRIERHTCEIQNSHSCRRTSPI